MPLNLNAKWRSHATPDERALVHIVDELTKAQRLALADLYGLRGIVVKRVQTRMGWRLKRATTDRRTK